MNKNNKPADRYNEGKPRWELLPLEDLEGTVYVLTDGAIKYDDDNWKRGMSWRSVFSSLMRHLTAWQSGEDTDPESGRLHIDHVMCNVLFLARYARRNPEYDDRKGIPIPTDDPDPSSDVHYPGPSDFEILLRKDYPEFYELLQSHDAVYAYIAGVYHQKTMLWFGEKLPNRFASNLLSAAFGWNSEFTSNQGAASWSKLNIMWQQVTDEYYPDGH